MVLLCRAGVRDPCYRVLQYIHDSLMVGGVSNISTDPSKWVVAYGSKCICSLVVADAC